MLTQTACQPLYGKFSDLIGRKVREPPKNHTIFVLRNTGPGCPLHEHVNLFYWFPFVWHIQGNPNHAISCLVLSLILPQSITWLILSRALSGVGGGGIVSSVWTITSEIVPVHKRAHWSQALSVESGLLSYMSSETERSNCSLPGHLLLLPAPYWVECLAVRSLAVQLNSMG